MVAWKRVVSPGSAAPDEVHHPDLQGIHLATWRLGKSVNRHGVSREAAATIRAAHRPSTYNLFYIRWQSFYPWCAVRGKDSPSPFYQASVILLTVLAAFRP